MEIAFFFFALSKKKKKRTLRVPTVSSMRWVICTREISVSWGLGHWQIRLLIAVVWDILSVSMSTLNPRNCSVPICPFFIPYKEPSNTSCRLHIQSHRESDAHGSLAAAVDQVKPGWKYGICGTDFSKRIFCLKEITETCSIIERLNFTLGRWKLEPLGFR